MAAAKRPVKKASHAKPARPAAKKAKSAVKAAARPVRKPATKPVAKSKAPVKAAAKVAPKTPAKPARRTEPKPVAKAATPPAKPITRPTGPKEMVVRVAPGALKAGRKLMTTPRSRPSRRDAHDPNALIHGIPPYQPRPGETYMNPGQLDHFRLILRAWKRELMEEVDRTVHHMQDEASNFPDPNDRATQESEFGLELRTRDRERKLLKKIDAALERIEDGSYGYCEETGEEIGLKRLEARPVATLSIEAQERREMAERQYGERDDRYR
jgi:DnaK suppressor protein